MKIEMRALSSGTATTTRLPNVIDYGASDRETPALRVVTMWLERAYDRAAASGYESAWERFVSEAISKAGEHQASDVTWLADRIQNGAEATFRRALSLVRVAGVIAEAQPKHAGAILRALPAMLAHPVAEVRAAVLEATSAADIAAAKGLARALQNDASQAVRESAAAIIAMTE